MFRNKRYLTINQRQQILNGERKVKEQANYAFHELRYSCSEVGTYFSKRGLRTNRGKQIN